MNALPSVVRAIRQTSACGSPTAVLCKGTYNQEPLGSWGTQPVSTFTKSFKHTYLRSMLPDKICVNFYDVHGGGTAPPSMQLVNGANGADA